MTGATLLKSKGLKFMVAFHPATDIRKMSHLVFRKFRGRGLLSSHLYPCKTHQHHHHQARRNTTPHTNAEVTFPEISLFQSPNMGKNKASRHTVRHSLRFLEPSDKTPAWNVPVLPLHQFKHTHIPRSHHTPRCVNYLWPLKEMLRSQNKACCHQ